ncbi:hypothetical protein B0O99DRAFT_595778 [Bisporella sp. PMI_857]|nr:hypothetical protein B0O99DRAFT_595778 [Bisporella sp. PMI_857]
MGNEQSAPGPRRQANRLSKPRTHSTAVPSNSRSPNPSSRRNSILQDVDNSNRFSTLPVEEPRVKTVEEPKKKRLSLFRSKSSQSKDSQLDIKNGVHIDYLGETPVRAVATNWSRTNSMVEYDRDTHYSAPIPRAPPQRLPSQNAPIQSRPPVRVPTRVSLQHVPYAQHYARLSLVPEAPSPQPNSKRQSLYREVSPQEESPELTHASRTNSDTQLYAPIRRRSLLQHGVATRNSWVENDSRSSLPSQMADSLVDMQTRYYNSEKPTSSPLAELANIEVKPVDLITQPRVATPNDMDYGSIGAFKLGSLRITNGAASPAPSLERANTIGAEEDYILVGNARPNRPTSRHGFGQRSQTISVPQGEIKPPWITRAESPLQKVENSEQHDPAPLIVRTDLTLPNPEFSLFKFTESPTKSLELAQEYMQDLALSPFSFDASPAISPKLEATSKHMAVEDNLFEPEPGTPIVSEAYAPGSFDSGYHANEGASTKDQRRAIPLAKADSGYSSNVSLRSFKGNAAPPAPPKEGPPTPPKDPVSTESVSRVASSTYSVVSVRSDASIYAKRSLPAIPKQERPPQNVPQGPRTPAKHYSMDSLGKSSLPYNLHKSVSQAPVVVKPHKEHEKPKNIPNFPKKVQQISNDSPSGSEVSSSSSSRWRPRRNSKSKATPQPLPLFTVQAFQSPSQQFDIPTPTAEASKKLGERVDAFPVTSFPNTLAGTTSLRRSVSKETLTTIFSVGSAEYKEELTMSRLYSALPDVPTPITEDPPPAPQHDVNRRNTYQPRLPAPVPVSRKPLRRQSHQPQVTHEYHAALQEKQQHDFEVKITSFDGVSSSLGKSPYDVAISSPNDKLRQEQRARSMTAQLEADAAARFAQRRSISAESQQTLGKRSISYDSITNKNPFSGQSTPSQSRQSSLGKPPSAHGNLQIRRFSQRSDPNLKAPQVPVPVEQTPPPQSSQQLRRFSELSNPDLRDEPVDRRGSLMSVNRIKSPPPVSMKTQGNMVPVKPWSTPPNRPAPTPAFKVQQLTTFVPRSVPSAISAPSLPLVSPTRPPPQPPVQSSPQNQPLTEAPAKNETQDPWAKQQSYWASRKQDAIKTRKSMELHRPEIARLSFEKQNGIQLRRPESVQPGVEGPRPWMPAKIEKRKSEQGIFNSWNTSMQKWDGYERRQASVEYDHTYGREYDAMRYSQYERQHDEAEYYDGPSYEEEDLSQAVHQRNASTSGMLVLEPFAGGLEYGYEPGLGLGGSAGTRNGGRMAKGSRRSVPASMDYGIDLSDVPVFLQRVQVES